jgi:CRISPR-associated endonuclease Cas3-HD
MEKEIYAKSNGVTLLEHSISVANKAKYLAEKLTDNNDLISCSVIAALFHDIGKCTNGFQSHLLNDEVTDYIPHNILSASIFYNYLSINGISDSNLSYIIRAILYHHPTNFRKLDFNSIQNISIDEYSLENDEIESINQMIDILLDEYKSFNLPLQLTKKCNGSCLMDINDSYFVDGNIKDINFFIISNIIKFSDFLVSSENNEDKYINGNYPNDISFIKPSYYDNRFDMQMNFAQECSKYRLSLFDTQTGFGKTLMGVRYLLNNGKKGYWVCPRNTIAEGLYQTITKELNVLGLDNSVSVALLLTNEWIYGNDECDIIVTNLDNFVRPSVKADANIYSFNMLYCNCIFDEFHEYVDDQALMALFNVVLHSRFECKNTKTLLLSATPILNFISKFENNENYHYIKYEYEPILSKKIKFSYSENLKLDKLNNKNWFISVNTVNKSQTIFQSGNVDNIVHARYIKTDLTDRLKQMYDEHGKNKNIPTSWVATNILSTGIDVSFGNMVVSWPTPERFIQAGGRCNRWNECTEIPIWHIVRDNKDFIEKCGVDSFTDKNFASTFYNFLTSNIQNNSIITLKTLYDKRNEFYITEKDSFNKLFKTTLKKSIENLKNLSYEYTFHPTNNDDTKYISNKCNLRKNQETISFFFKVKDYTTKKFIDDVIQGDNRMVNLKTLKDDSSIDYMYKAIKNNIKDYFKSQKIMDNIYKKSKTNFFDCIFDKATCNKTPLLIGNNYYYDKTIGLFKSC